MTVTTYAATCHTQGCVNADVDVDVDYDDLDGELPPAPSIVVCGGCSAPIDDVTPIARPIGDTP